ARLGRARRLAREGACSKAAAGLSSSIAAFQPDEEREWARVLLPRSEHPERACAERRTEPAAADVAQGAPAASRIDAVCDEIRKVRFSPGSAPGPSGQRPEHIKELIGTRRHRAGRRFLRALAVFVIAASEGHLDDEARWILDSKVVFIKKKNGSA
ncbi:MAG: hypothetical protein ACKPKO_12485, partial [Candidatus Fonsibacter sp.]